MRYSKSSRGRLLEMPGKLGGEKIFSHSSPHLVGLFLTSFGLAGLTTLIKGFSAVMARSGAVIWRPLKRLLVGSKWMSVTSVSNVRLVYSS